MPSLKQLQEFASALHESRAAGRNCGRTLHDIAGPVLMGMGLRLQVLKMDHPEASADIDQILANLDHAMERKLRALSQSFLPLSPVHGLGFRGAVEQLVANLQRRFSGTIRLKVGLGLKLESEMAVPLYDALEHALEQAVARRGAKKIKGVDLGHEADSDVRVEDDGKPEADKPLHMARLFWRRAAGIRFAHLTRRGTIVLIHGIHRVLLVDDHKIVRDGMGWAILDRSNDFDVVGEAENGSDALQFAKRLRPELVLMDLGLPGLNGVESTTEILRSVPETKVVVLSMYDDENSVLGALRAGARGFLLKKASELDLLGALKMVAQGGMYVSPQVSDRLLHRIQKGNLEEAPTPPLLAGLSPREIQVLRLVAEGKSSKEIATLLDLSEQTVRSYRKSLMRKLRVNNAVTLTQVAYSTGLTQVPDDQPRAATATHR